MAICTNPKCQREEKYLSKGLCRKCYAKQWRTGTLEYTQTTNAQKGLTKCSNPSCSKEGGKIVKGLCKACYYRQWHTGSVSYQVRERKPCKTEGCEKLAVAKGLCDTHRKRVDRKGSVEAGGRPIWWGKYEERLKRKRNTKFKENFGITLDDYNKMFEEQGGVCQICEKAETRIDPRTGYVFNLAVDHCHTTGKVRGLLCMSHNAAIGMFGDDPELLESAIAYLRKYRQA